MKSKESRPYLGFLKEYAFKKKLLPSYILTIATIVLTAGVSLVRPELQGKVIDDLGNPHSTSLSAFMLLLVVFLGMLLLNYLMNYVQRYIVAVISEEIAADMRQKVEDKLSTVSVNFFEKIKLSDILLKVDKDVSAVKQCGITSIITLVSNIVILVVVPPYMFSIHKGIAVSNIILLVSVPFISRILGKLIQETSGQVLEGYNSITNVLTNTYDNWFITRLFQCGQYVHDMYFEKNQKYKKETNRQNLLYILNTSTILVIQFIGTVIIWVVGAQEVFKGNMTIGTIMALMNYQTIIMNPIIGIAQFANEYHTAVVSLKDINGLLQYPDQKQGDGEKVTTVNNISLEEMSFSYTESNKKVFDRLNLKFEKGTLYGVHGKSGQGKSTLFKIITGVYQPTEGKVVVNNTDLQELDINSYWENTGYVMQRTQFFNDTVRRNMGLLHITFIYEKTNEMDLYRLIDIAAKYDIDVLFNIVSSVGRAKENSEILTDMEHLDMNLKIVKYILNQGYEDKKIGGAFYQRVQVRNSCGGYGKVMAIFPEGDIYMCQCMEQNQVRMGNILSDEPQKILQELENLLKKDEIKRLFCAEYKEICKECDYRYICGGHCLASEEPYDYRCIFLKAVLNYVLFYYDSKANRRKNLEIYIEYMEEVKRRWEEEPN